MITVKLEKKDFIPAKFQKEARKVEIEFYSEKKA